VTRPDRTQRVRLLLGAVVVLVCSTCIGPVLADEQADRLRLRALTEEGGLIVEEAAGLRPAAESLAAEGAELDLAETALRAEQADLNQAIARFNTEHLELERALKEYKAGCPPGSADVVLIEACNARALEFNAAAQRHEAQRPLLEARQREVPARIETQNEARRAWAQRKHEQEPRLHANRTDAEYWLGSARAFIASEAFGALVRKAGAPAACAAATLGDLAVPPAMAAVERAHTCLKAVTKALG